jgi:isoquinoline 1-oxidoreductase subunit alpha
MIDITLNGAPRQLDLDPDMPLLWALRDHLELTGTKFGCGAAQCGACTVLVDGVATRSCVTPVSGIAGQKVTTIEGVSGKVGNALTAAWIKLDVAQCGACTVLVDGVATRSCVTPVSGIAGQKVTTIEGVSGKVGNALTAAWIKLDVAQCGYCQSGQIMSALALLEANRKPSDAEIDAAMSGNLCRCATYQRIRGAIHEAARMLDV